jgi:hypothetical protein
MCMVLEELLGKKFTPPMMAQYAIKCGARGGNGTSITKLSNAIKMDFKVDFKTTNSEEALKNHLIGGGFAIALSGGDRGNYKGVFSNGGHYVAVASYYNSLFEILDPGMYRGKYSLPHRKNKVTVKGNRIFCSESILRQDTVPTKYYLYSKQEDEEMEKTYNWTLACPAWSRPTVQKLLDKGYLKGDEKGQLGLTDTMLKLLVINDRAGLYDKK